MRVIGGEFRSRALKSLPGLDVRPTPDRLREALFNVLGAAHRRRGLRRSIRRHRRRRHRGAEPGRRDSAIFVEQKHAAVRAIRENLRSLGIEGRAEVRQGRATAMIPRLEADIVFLDPPYALENEYTRLRSICWVKSRHALVVAQHPPRLKLAEIYGALHRTRLVKQGDNALSFYEPGVTKD